MTPPSCQGGTSWRRSRPSLCHSLASSQGGFAKFSKRNASLHARGSGRPTCDRKSKLPTPTAIPTFCAFFTAGTFAGILGPGHIAIGSRLTRSWPPARVWRLWKRPPLDLCAID